VVKNDNSALATNSHNPIIDICRHLRAVGAVRDCDSHLERGGKNMAGLGDSLSQLGKGLIGIGLGITVIVVIIILFVLMAGCVLLLLASHSMVMLPLLI
jgi:hypothetical protein